MSISIIIPVYNGVEEYFRICMDSILNQSYRDIEVIIVDDGSTDDMAAVIDEFGRLDSRIKVIHQSNSGVSSARNRGIEISTGDWIMFVDADDYLAPDACSGLITELGKYDPDILYFNIYQDCDGNICKERYGLPENCIGRNLLDIKPLLYERFLYVCKDEIEPYRNEIMGITTNRILRGSFVRENRLLFNKKIPMGEDTLHNLYTCSKAEQIYFCENYCYYYRVNSFSANHKFREQAFNERMVFFRELDTFFTQENLSLQGNLANAFYARILNDTQRALMYNSFHKDFSGNFSKRMNSAREFLKNEYTTEAIQKLDPAYIKLKQKIKLFIIKHRLVFVDYLLSRLIFN